MANSKTIWRGSGSAKLTITSIQTNTAENRHISSYAFYCDTTDLSGNVIDASTYTTTITSNTRVDKFKDYTITSYLNYGHKFADGSTTAVSNKVNTTITVHEPLDKDSLNSISLPSNGYWVWSNDIKKDFIITPEFNALSPYSYEGQYISDSTVPTAAKGSIQHSAVGDITSQNIKTLTWKKTTSDISNSTDLEKRYENIIIKVKSTEKSAPSAVEIADRTATIQVRNAVLGLTGLADEGIHGRATTYITQTVRFNPITPYDTSLKLVATNGTAYENNTVTIDGSVLTLNGNTITLDASKSTNTTANTLFDFIVRSEQSASAVDTPPIRFTVIAVKDITDKKVVEGQTFTITDAGIGTITHAEVTRGPIKVVSTSGASITLQGTAVDENSPWTVTIQNAKGTTITITGTTEALGDITVNINTGDYIVLGSTTFGNTLGKVKSVSSPSAGIASVVNDGEFKFEAYSTTGPIAAATYPVVVTGENGATQTVNVVVSDIAVTVD